jgi:uncharacterized membrane protein
VTVFWLLVAIAIYFTFRRIDALGKDIAALKKRINSLEKGQLTPARASPAATTVPPRVEQESEAPSTTPSPSASPVAPSPQHESIPLLGKDWEKKLAERWFVWLGALALALGGAFLVKFSIDYGLLIP